MIVRVQLIINAYDLYESFQYTNFFKNFVYSWFSKNKFSLLFDMWHSI